MADTTRDELGVPNVVDRATFQAELDALRVREKAHTHEGDAIAAARRRLPMVEIYGRTPLIGERGAVTLLDTFEGRRQLIAYYFMWHTGHPAPEQCEGRTWVTSQIRELSYIHSRDVTYATFCQGPYEECVPIGAIILYPMIAFSGLFVPIANLPTVLRTLARVLPLTYAVQLLEGIWNGDGWLAHMSDVVSMMVLFLLLQRFLQRYFAGSSASQVIVLRPSARPPPQSFRL